MRGKQTWSGGIHASGNLPCESSVLSQRASARSVLARRFLTRSARVSTISARWGTAPRARAPDDEVPPRARLEREVNLPVRKAPHPLDYRLGVGRDPARLDLTGDGVEHVEGDLGAMDVEACVYDAHEGPPPALDLTSERRVARQADGGPSVHVIYPT
jgi:hypothetical protein